MSIERVQIGERVFDVAVCDQHLVDVGRDRLSILRLGGLEVRLEPPALEDRQRHAGNDRGDAAPPVEQVAEVRALESRRRSRARSAGRSRRSRRRSARWPRRPAAPRTPRPAAARAAPPADPAARRAATSRAADWRRAVNDGAGCPQRMASACSWSARARCDVPLLRQRRLELGLGLMQRRSRSRARS